MARRIHQRKAIDASLAAEVKEVVASVTNLAREFPNDHNLETGLVNATFFDTKLCSWKTRLVTITKTASDALMAEHGALVAESTKQMGELADQLFGLRFSVVRPRKLQRIWSCHRQTWLRHTLWRR